MYLIKYEKQAVKDIKNLKGAKLDGKAKALIEILKRNPLEPPCESLVGNLSNDFRRCGLIFSYGDRPLACFSKNIKIEICYSIFSPRKIGKGYG